MIDRQILHILRETGRLGSVTAAAEVLHLTQPALSHAVRKFEERFNVRLWQKEGRGVRLTDAGLMILNLSERILPQLEHTERVLNDYGHEQRGILRVGMECHPCQHWLMRVVAPFLKAWPLVDLDIHTALQFGGMNALLSHEIDMLITPDPVDVSGLTFRRIFGYELVLAVPSDHALGEVARPEDLREETLLTYPVSSERLDIFTRFLGPARCQPKVHRKVASTDMMLHLVAAKRGVSSVPDWLLREAGASLPVRAVRLGEAGLPMALYIGTRKDDAGIRYIEGFLKTAVAIAQNTEARIS